MQNFSYKVKIENGIHARPAGELVKKCKEYKCNVVISCGDKSADGKRLISLMGLGIKQNDIIKVTTQGDDDAEAAEQLKTFCINNL